jgi:hypothetical protein
MPRVDWRFLVLVLTRAAVWWTFTLTRGCGDRPRPLEWVPTEQQPIP